LLNFTYTKTPIIGKNPFKNFRRFAPGYIFSHSQLDGTEFFLGKIRVARYGNNTLEPWENIKKKKIRVRIRVQKKKKNMFLTFALLWEWERELCLCSQPEVWLVPSVEEYILTIKPTKSNFK
jgi:hypothetical protein